MNRIIQVFTRYSPPYFKGGIETFIYNFSSYLFKKGYESEVIAMKDEFPYKDEQNNIIKLKVPKIPVFVALLFQRKFWKYAKNGDVVTIHYPTLGVFKPKNKKAVLILHTLASEEGQYYNRASLKGYLRKLYRVYFAGLLEKITFRKVEHIVCLNQDIYQKLLKRKVPKEKISLIKNGVDTEKFAFTEPRALKEDDKVRFLYVGRLIERKNIKKMLEAFSALNRNDFKLTIVGVGPLEQQIEELVSTRYAHLDIEFLGYKSGDDLIEEYQKCDVYILPSFYEGLPFTLLEAMSTGKPAVVGGFANAPDIINEGKNGYIIQHNTKEDLAETINKSMENKAEISKKAYEARRIIVNQYSLNSSLKEIEVLFRNLGIMAYEK